MKLYRVAKQKYLEDLSGQGARLYGGRWNKVGHNMLYCSTNLSLCVLEILVHMDYQFFTQDFGFIELEFPEDIDIEDIPARILKQNWRQNPPLSFTQDYGTNWLLSNKKLALKVPSAVLPYEYNVLINPNHVDFSTSSIIRKAPLDVDNRLWQTKK